MKAGDIVTRVIALSYDSGPYAGTGLVYPNAAAFVAAGWALTWYDTTLTALASQPTYTLTPVAGSTQGEHVLAYTLPAGRGHVLSTRPSGMRSDPAAWAWEGLTYDDDAIGAQLQASQGVAGVFTLTDGNLGDVVDGASFNSGLQQCPLLAFSRFGLGYADVANNGTWALTAAVKHKNSDTRIPITCARDAAFGTTGNITLGWNAWPSSSLSLDSANDERSKEFFVDAEFAEVGGSNRIIVPLRFTFNVVWRRYAT